MLVSVFGAICMRRTDSVEGLLCRMDSAGAVGCVCVCVGGGGGGGAGRTALGIRTHSVSRAE